MLRLTSGSVHRLVDRERGGAPSPIALAKRLCPQLSLASLQPVLCPRASELLVNYDEHVLVNNFKFGVIYQRAGQTSEEALFGNRDHSPALDRFLEMIGHRVNLASHQGYRGGLDTQFGQTGEQSVYTEHCGKEVMYHVISTFIHFSETDPPAAPAEAAHRQRHRVNRVPGGQHPLQPRQAGAAIQGVAPHRAHQRPTTKCYKYNKTKYYRLRPYDNVFYESLKT